MRRYIAKIIAMAITGCLMPALPALGTPVPDVAPRQDSVAVATGKWIEVDVHAGVGMTSVMQNYSSGIPGVTDFMLSPGVQFRGGLGVRFNLSHMIGLGTGMEFGINNYRYSMSLQLSQPSGSMSTLYVTNHFYQITVPVYVSWRLDIGRRMKWNVDMGCYFALGAGGDQKARGYNTGENNLGQPVVLHAAYKAKYFEKERPLLNGVRNFDIGYHMATGLTYRQRYTLNAVLQLGARNLAINRGVLDLKYHNLSLMFQIGYIF